MLLPSGARVGEMVSRAVEEAYLTGALPPLLPHEMGADVEG